MKSLLISHLETCPDRFVDIADKMGGCAEAIRGSSSRRSTAVVTGTRRNMGSGDPCNVRSTGTYLCPRSSGKCMV
ncbi:hypothetical protein MRX96_046616 [Rhipicephalus microplus]